MLIKEKISIGVDIGSNMIKIIGLRKKKRIKVEFLKSVDLYASRNVKRPEDLNDTTLVQIIRGLCKEIKGGVKKIKTTISGPNVFIRTMELPVLSDDEIKSAIKWKLKSVIPLNTDNIEFDWQILNTNKSSNTQSIIVAVVPTSEMKKHLDILTRANLEPEIVEVDTLAIYNCFITLEDLKPNKTIAILNIGAERTSLIILHPNHNSFFNSIKIGGNALTRTIERKLHTSFIVAEQQKIEMNNQQLYNNEDNAEFKWKESLHLMVNKLSEEIKRADIYYQILYGEEGLDRIYLTGGGSKLKNLAFLLAYATKIPVFLWNPFKSDKLEYNQEIEDIEELGPHFTTVLGITLRDKL